MDKFDKIFSPSRCITNETMQKYVSGMLNAEEKHLVEKHLIDCEMCSDEVEGLSLINQSNLNSIVSDINTQIDIKILKKNKKVRLINYRIQAAAAVILILIFFSAFYIKNHFNDKSQQLFSEYFEPYEEKTDIISDNPEKENDKIIVSESLKDEKIAEKDVNSLSKSMEKNQSDYQVEQKTEVVSKESLKPQSATRGGNSIDIVDDLEINLDADVAESPEAEELSLSYDVALSDDFVSEDIAEAEKADNLNTDKTKNLVGGVSLTQTDEGFNSTLNVSGEGGKAKKDASFADRREVANESSLQEESKVSGNTTEANVEIVSSKKTKGNRTAKSSAMAVQEQAPAPITSTVAINNVGDYNNGLTFYNTQKYSDAIISFTNSINNGINTYKSKFYIGVSYLNINDIDNAIKYLEEIENETDKEFFNDTQWYLALCYTKVNKISNAKKLLQNIIKSNSGYKAKAEKLLDEIN